MKKLGSHLRARRLELLKDDKRFSLRQVSRAIGIEPSYLSKIERGQPLTLSEDKTVALAELLQEDPDYLLALGGKISQDVQSIIKERPMLFSRLVRQMKDMPDETITADQEFKRVNSILHRLHGLASIGAFQFSDDPAQCFWTNQVPRILGLQDDVAPNAQALRDAMTTQSRQAWDKALREADKEHTEFECELQAGREEALKYLRIWGYCDTSEDGSPQHTGIIQDITERVTLRNQILEARDSLELTVEHQNSEITTAIRDLQQEVQRRKKLETKLLETNEAISAKAEQQHHFFKQSVFKLRSLITGLYSEMPDDSKRGGTYLRRISAKINDLSDYYLGPPDICASSSSCDPKSLIRETLAMFEKEAETKSISLSSHFAPDVPESVALDNGILERVLIVLLELFCTHTPWGQVQVVVSDDADKSELSIAMSSTSLDCPLTGQDIALGPTEFPRTHCPGDAQLVGPLVKCLGGRATVQSVAGSGHCVILEVPYGPVEERVSSQVSSEGPVLIVEDDDSSRIYVETIIKRGGYEFVSTETGSRALELVKQQAFGLILLDIQLPEVNGEDIVLNMRNEPGPNRHTPVIAITAHATQEDREQFLSSGINDVIAKPFDIETLMQRVQAWLGTDSASRPVA